MGPWDHKKNEENFDKMKSTEVMQRDRINLRFELTRPWDTALAGPRVNHSAIRPYYRFSPEFLYIMVCYSEVRGPWHPAAAAAVAAAVMTADFASTM